MSSSSTGSTSVPPPDTCFVCGDPAGSEEHIFPKWLQGKYDLWNQRMRLPNGTTITYRQLTIPCCKDCNNNILSRLETKIQQDKANDKEVWRWALKIHFGLTKKDDFLAWDRRNPGYSIGQVVNREDPLELDRHLAHSIYGAFSTSPDPFGSVFRFKFEQEVDFHFAHLHSPAGIAICFGKVGYVVFIQDTGTLNRQPDVARLYERHLSRVHPAKVLNFFANAWVHLYRFPANFSIMTTPGSIAILSGPKLIEERSFTDEQYRELWAYITDNPNATIIDKVEYDKTDGIERK